MRDLKKLLGDLIEKAANADKASEAMQYAQAAANAANAVLDMSSAGLFKIPERPEEMSVPALMDLLERAKQSPTQSIPLPTNRDAKIAPAAKA